MTGYDLEISDMLKRLQGTEKDLDALGALLRFRAEALAGARDAADAAGKEELVRQARERLREALRQLLA